MVYRVARERDSAADVYVVVRSDGDLLVAWRPLQHVATQEDLLLPLRRRNRRHLRSVSGNIT